MELTNQLLKKILGNNEKFVFEDKLVISSIFFLCVISLVGVLINIFIGLSCISVVTPIITFVIYLYVYILARFKGKAKYAKLIFSIYSFLLCNLFWIGNYGSKGPSIYIFIPYIAIMVLIWENAQIKIISFAILVNVIVLLFIEYLVPGISGNYPTETARIIDSYTGLLMFMGLLLIMVVYAKNNYIKEYERAKKSDMLKSAFLANMSHEIRTPLNAILGFSKMLIKRELPKDKKEQYAKIITDNSDYLLKLISDILDISMIESGQLKIKKKEVNMDELIKKVYTNQKNVLHNAGKKDIEFILNLPNTPLYVISDEFRVEQILTNMINNAIKFTQQGKINIGYYRDSDMAKFFIEDTGIGIKPEFSDEVFDRFVKTDNTVDSSFVRGSGIGLALSKELAHILGGTIWFESEYQKGTKFYFTLPAN